MEIVKKNHGELLLMGDVGYIVVELAGSWALVMIVTGLYLWWPRQLSAATVRFVGILYPRLGAGGRIFWRDIHAVMGVWVSVLALFPLASALPWTTVRGGALKQAHELAASD